MWTAICTTLLLITGFLLIFIILLQRGRGGGLAGAFGGAGGHSAFGTKAGDVFTKITIVMAVIWVVLAGVTGFAMRAERSSFKGTAPDNPVLNSKTGKTTESTTKTPPKKKTDKKTPEKKTDT